MKEVKPKMYYSSFDLAKKFGMKQITVIKRMASPSSKYLWGVKEIKLPNGRVQRFVPHDKLHLWTNPVNMHGRVIKAENK